MRVILVGTGAARTALRMKCESHGMTVVGEAATLDAARALEASADALVVAPRGLPRLSASTDEPPAVEALTPRELEIIALLAEGLPNKGIAARLGISDQTVKFHVASIYGKLGASNRTDAVRRALRRGILTL
jgi:DNA-binding CsgD family transcriptional regulator